MNIEAIRWQQIKEVTILYVWATHIWRQLPERAGGAISSPVLKVHDSGTDGRSWADNFAFSDWQKGPKVTC